MHEILVELEFTSERARMSVVARAPDGTIRLFTKGSDAVRLPCVPRAVAQLTPLSPKRAPMVPSASSHGGSDVAVALFEGVMLTQRILLERDALHRTVLQTATPGEQLLGSPS